MKHFLRTAVAKYMNNNHSCSSTCQFIQFQGISEHKTPRFFKIPYLMSENIHVQVHHKNSKVS